MPSIVDNFIVLIAGFVQWRIGRAALRRWPGRLTQAAIGLVVLLMIAGFSLTFSKVRSRLGFNGPLVHWTAATAFIWIFVSTGAWFWWEIVRIAGRVLRVREFSPDRRRLLEMAGAAVIASPAVITAYGALVQRTNFAVQEIDLPVSGLPADLENLRLVQLSDIHLSEFLSEDQLARVIDMANETRPHLALVTGDLISARGDPIDACLRQLSRLRADAGILGCLGNHETYAGLEKYATVHGARLGVRFLRMQAEPLRFGGATLNFVGVDYQPRSMRESYLAGTEKLQRPGAINVLLSHNPDVIPTAAAKGFHATLSGHTHGGQITVEILDQAICPARFLTPFIYGLYRTGSASAYVTRGIGTIGIPARIGAPPEIALLRLKRA